MNHQTGMTGWPSGNILNFRAILPEIWGSNPGGEKEICLCKIYRRYLINALLLYIEFRCVLLIMISSIIIIAQRRSTVDR